MSQRVGESDERWRERHRDAMRVRRAANPKRACEIAASHRCRNAETIRAQKLAQRDRYEALKAGPCADCNNTFPPECMDWDHVRGEKIKNMGAMGAHVGPMLLAEIEKCDLVCSNCRRIRTRRRSIAR